MNFVGLIEREAKTISALQANVHATFKNRSSDRETWSRACEKFHSYVSSLSVFINRVHNEKEFQDEEILEFGITYLELDPIYYRSGYIKEVILTKIKRSKLSKKQIERLRTVLLKAVENRGSKEYKYYCRLAGFIADDEFIDELKLTVTVGNGTVKYRARKMLKTISHSKAHNKFKNLRSLRSLARAENARPF